MSVFAVSRVFNRTDVLPGLGSIQGCVIDYARDRIQDMIGFSCSHLVRNLILGRVLKRILCHGNLSRFICLRYRGVRKYVSFY